MINNFKYFSYVLTFFLIIFSIHLFTSKKIYFNTAEVGNLIELDFGMNNNVFQISNLSKTMSDVKKILNESNNYVWIDNNTFLIYFFSDNLSDIEIKMSKLEEKISFLNSEYKNNFINNYDQISDYNAYKNYYITKYLDKNVERHSNLNKIIHEDYRLYRIKIEKTLKRINRNEKIIYFSDINPIQKEYLYKNINKNFIFNFLIIILIGSIFTSFIINQFLKKNDF